MKQIAAYLNRSMTNLLNNAVFYFKKNAWTSIRLPAATLYSKGLQKLRCRLESMNRIIICLKTNNAGSYFYITKAEKNKAIVKNNNIQAFKRQLIKALRFSYGKQSLRSSVSTEDPFFAITLAEVQLLNSNIHAMFFAEVKQAVIISAIPFLSSYSGSFIKTGLITRSERPSGWGRNKD